MGIDLGDIEIDPSMLVIKDGLESKFKKDYKVKFIGDSVKMEAFRDGKYHYFRFKPWMRLFVDADELEDLDIEQLKLDRYIDMD